MKILGIGNALVDVLVLLKNDNILEEMKFPKGSMQLIDDYMFTKLNLSIANSEKLIASGGSASNTIAAMGRLGVDTGFIGKVGTDFYGNYFKEDLVRCGTKSHLIVEDAVSGVATTLISPDGERTFGTYLGIAANLKPEDLKPEQFEGYDYFYIEGYLVQNLDLIRKAIELAKKAGAKIIWDMASYNVVEGSRDFLFEIIPEHIDIIFANEEEAKALLNVEVEEALSILSKQVELIIIKEGAKGSWIQRGDEKISIATNKISRIDTTGAGDWYAAGFLYGLANDFSLELCGKIGNFLAENIIQVVGARFSEDQWLKIDNELKKML
nr:adenosine kinase [Dysgonomonas sp. 520]